MATTATRLFEHGYNITPMHTWATADPAIYTLDG